MKKIRLILKRLFMTKREKFEEKLLEEYNRGNFLGSGVIKENGN